ncbi:hypothetical protein BGZ58_002129, partial [Dissophora ornata]
NPSSAQGFRLASKSPTFAPSNDNGTSKKSKPIYITTCNDSITGEKVIFWDEILRLFPNAQYLKNGSTSVPFVRDKSMEMYA